MKVSVKLPSVLGVPLLPVAPAGKAVSFNTTGVPLLRTARLVVVTLPVLSTLIATCIYLRSDELTKAVCVAGAVAVALSLSGTPPSFSR